MIEQHHFFTPADVPDSLIDRLILASEAVVRYRIAAYRDGFDLTEIQYRVLAHVAQHAPITLSHLARLVNRDCAQISRMVKTLIARGLVRNGRPPGKQAMAIELTDTGRETRARMARIGQDWEAAVENLLSTDQIALASVAIDRLYDAARQVLGGTDHLAGRPTADPRLAAIAVR